MWEKIKKFFKDSETIFYSRMQALLGIITAIIVAIMNDPSINEAIKEVLNPKYIPYYLIAMGLLGEYLRRRRADDL